ncbi:hypothetical protein [Lysinibacillus sp. FSL M8-0355]|uniref:hypothetical protein n=1 Tax=Lysinibacillus sp. FSL M8-0355 TaxID=2921719 RepID=UPI0030FA3EDE
MNDSFEIYRAKETLIKGRTHYDYNKHCNVSGVIDLLSGGVNLKAMKMVEESTHILICGVDDIQIGDYVTCNGNTKRVYEVTFVDNPMNRNHHLEVELKFLPDQEIEE